MLEVAFELPGEPSVPYAALLPRVVNRYEIWLNGTLLSRSGELGVAGSADFAKAPRYVPIPPQILQKNNLLRIHLDVDGGRRGGLAAVTVGTEQSIRALYEASYLWRVSGALAVLIVMLLCAAVSAWGYHTQQLELLAREQERSAERTRILRDMHDGVGSHISAAIRQLQSGKATDGEVLTTLRDSLDQLKLSIDAIHLVPGDVTAMLANMRYRLEPCFVSSDIAFEWDVDLLPPIARLDHSALRQLQYMAFETLSNVLQHAQARTLRIEARVLDITGSTLPSHTTVIRFIDNGKGFDAQAVSTRSLASLRERAQAIGAQLVLHSVPGRTVVEIYS